MISIRAIVLAAGKSTRFGAYFNKLLTPLCGMPLVTHITDLLQACALSTTVVVGHLKEQVTAAITAQSSQVTFVTQEEPLGTGHALLCSVQLWDSDHLLVLNGDMPLITQELINQLIQTHAATGAAVSFVMAYPDTLNHAYGRVVINGDSVEIIENKDFTGDRSVAYPINAGIYIFKRSFLKKYAAELQPNNAQKQLYVTDLIGIASRATLGCNPVLVDYALVHGVNTLAEFAAVTAVMRERIMLRWLNAGVLIEDPATTWIDATVTIGEGTRIASGVHLRGTTTVGMKVVIEPYAVIKDSTLHDMVTIQSHSVIEQSIVPAHSIVGPCAHMQLNKITIPTNTSPSSSAYHL
jgi:bifunctional UDP-N-acetylglucosamine pyrophosphorylase/glucosamine-1-phosphate N-acetyltransferase